MRSLIAGAGDRSLQPTSAPFVLTSGQDCVRHDGRVEDLAPPPDGHGDGGVAHGDDDGGDDEDGERHETHVDLPLPRVAELYPTLSPEHRGLLEVEEEEDGG